MDNRNAYLNLEGMVLQDVRQESGGSYAICKTREGQITQFPIDQQHVRQFSERKGQSIDLDLICRWDRSGVDANRSGVDTNRNEQR